MEKDINELINSLKNNMEELRMRYKFGLDKLKDEDKATSDFFSPILNANYYTCDMVINKLEEISYEYNKQIMKDKYCKQSNKTLTN